jgi:prepilin-type N-terminal cleavage/methylation domain-containing protein
VNRIRKSLKKEEGFTLIELLIVIIILGILVAIVIFGVSTFRRNAAKSACQTDLKQVKTAAAAYLASNNGVSAADSNTLVTSQLLESYPSGGGQYTIVYTKTGAGTYSVAASPADCVIP